MILPSTCRANLRVRYRCCKYFGRMKLTEFGLGIGLGLIIFAAPVRSELVLDTQQVILSTERGKSVDKTIRVTATEDIAQPLQITPSDLELANGSARVPAGVVTIANLDTSLSANQTEILEIQIEGDALYKSGEFVGNLLIQYDGNSQTLPLTVQVKSRAWLPWLVLLAGAGLGTALSLYRTVGLPKDELLVRVGKLRSQMRGDAEATAGRFKARVESELIAVETALSNRDWKTAETYLQAAQTVWMRWLGGKPDWILQIAYLDTLLDQVNDTNAYQQAMQARLETIQRQLADCETPQALADLVRPVREQLERYRRGSAWLNELFDLATKLNQPAKTEQWKQTVARLEKELENLNPEEHEAFTAWLDKVKASEQELSQAVAQQETTRSIASSDRGGTAFFPQVSPLQSMPVVGQRSRQVLANDAQRSLIRFRVVSQTAAIALIAWLGMAELYEQDATFGDRPISDYFGLFAWGFGAEVSRDAIVKALGDLKPPLSKKTKENL